MSAHMNARREDIYMQYARKSMLLQQMYDKHRQHNSYVRMIDGIENVGATTATNSP